jgi:hypothetical protein
MLTIRLDDKPVREMLAKLGKQIPAATADAINHTLFAARKAIQAQMSRDFDRPTPYTLNSMYVDKAKASELKAQLWFKKLEAKSASGYSGVAHYLIPQIFGGRRKRKQFESQLQRSGAMPAGTYAVPGPAAELDQYGNMRARQITQVMAWLQAFGEEGYDANVTARSRTRALKGSKTRRPYAFFAANGKDRRTRHLPPGVYKRVKTAWGWALQAVLLFVKTPRYRTRLQFFEVGQKTIQATLPRAFDKAYAARVR